MKITKAELKELYIDSQNSKTVLASKSPSEAYDMPVIGIIKTKKLNYEISYDGGEKEKRVMDSDTLEVISEQDDFYVCNRWYKPDVPQVVHKDLVETFTKFEDDKTESDVEVFRWGQMQFDVSKALELYGDKEITMMEVSPQMKLPLVRVDKDHSKSTDLSKPILFATVEMGGEEGIALIDGYHRVTKALEEGVKELPAIILNKEESDNISMD